MTAYVALVRAVNVSGTGKLPKEELKAMGEACGFDNVRTFINSGNLLFTSDLAEAAVKERVEQKLDEFFGKPVPAFVRNAEEMAEVAQRTNPFSDDKPNQVMAHFIDDKPVQAMIDEARDVQGGAVGAGPAGHLYLLWRRDRQTRSSSCRSLKQGTARNMNSVARMAELLAGME